MRPAVSPPGKHNVQAKAHRNGWRMFHKSHQIPRQDRYGSPQLSDLSCQYLDPPPPPPPSSSQPAGVIVCCVPHHIRSKQFGMLPLQLVYTSCLDVQEWKTRLAWPSTAYQHPPFLPFPRPLPPNFHLTPLMGFVIRSFWNAVVTAFG